MAFRSLTAVVWVLAASLLAASGSAAPAATRRAPTAATGPTKTDRPDRPAQDGSSSRSTLGRHARARQVVVAAKSTPTTGGKSGAKKRKRWVPRIPKGYAATVKRWHTPTPGRGARLDREGRPVLTLDVLNTGETIELEARSDEGGFSAEGLDRAAHALRDSKNGNEHPVEPALLDLVYRLQREFRAHSIRVVSGYRTPHGHGRSNHGRGRAMDLVVPGATDRQVAAYARALGYTGVGVYPSSGFVHVDIRPASYFWVDPSGPGQRRRESAVNKHDAARSDARAKSKGLDPPRAFTAPLPDVALVWPSYPARGGSGAGRVAAASDPAQVPAAMLQDAQRDLADDEDDEEEPSSE